ncbi:hypothetical protein FAES_1632 [Fibrella aestuarina BUZ 2]|uniref:Uncharacterized protein n=1 Tax=Fibrella aestuarina BUZ 2 TaxID=1166018 RepID=I0K689_9BACT|nr:hypothetical protein [Fibrella aestuarina]CCG99642.1 hypothetical protein FAES_1632 [Fibrella aestuarina BUZ 2]
MVWLSVLFVAITLLAFGFIWLATRRDRRIGWLYTGWIVIVSLLAYTGFFQVTTAFPPRLIFVLIPAAALVTYLYRTLYARNVPTAWLLAIHGLRLPVELGLHGLYEQKQVPVFMTFESWNFDILSGLSALGLLAYTLLTKRELPPTLVRVWNWLGLLLLAIIVLTAILSAPSPIQQLAFDQPNVAILSFPFTLLPAVIVPTVLLAHLLALKRLRALK